jgi:hypothetical protein
MIVADFSLLGLKIGSIQTGLSNLFDLNQNHIPIFKRDEKHCKNVINETKSYQTLLMENNSEYFFENKNNRESYNNNRSKDFFDYVSVDLFGNILNNENSDCMANNAKFEELRRQRIADMFGIEDFDEYSESNIISYPDNRYKMIKRICPHCGAVDANVNKWEERKYKNKENIKVKYYVQSYICNKCKKWFITPVKLNLDKGTKEKIRLDKKIHEIHANTSLSFDKIAEILEITMNINVSHQYIRKVVQKEHDDFIYKTEIVELPEDFKKKGKTSQEREVTDIGILTMFKKKNMEISGEIEADELFTDINGRRHYLVNVFANEIKEMPIAVGIVNNRHFDVMKRFFDFIFEDNDFNALTSDMLGVYKKIAKKAKAIKQDCIFHWMKYSGKTIFDKIKKEEYSEKDAVWYLMLFTEMKEILRSFDKEKTQKLIAEFEGYLANIPEFMVEIRKKFLDKIKKLTAYTENKNVLRTTSKSENFNSLPQIRHIKHTSKKSQALLLSISSIIKFYKPNYRTLKNRQ